MEIAREVFLAKSGLKRGIVFHHGGLLSWIPLYITERVQCSCILESEKMAPPLRRSLKKVGFCACVVVVFVCFVVFCLFVVVFLGGQ